MTSLDGINGWSIQTLLRGENDSKQSDEFQAKWSPVRSTIILSIYTLRDLGDLSNLIGSLSRTTQQYSPPSEWIMGELGVFPIFLGNDLLKVDKILRLTFFKARKDLEGFNTAFFNLLLLSFVLNELFTTLVYWRRRSRLVNSAFSNKKSFGSKCLQKFYASSKQEKE